MVWTTTAGTHIGIKECAAADNADVGNEVDIVLTAWSNIVVTGGNAQTIAAGAAVAVTGITTGNHLCWNAGTSAVDVTCAGPGTHQDAGTVGCGAANDVSMVWTTTAGTHIGIKECAAADNADVGNEVDIVLTAWSNIVVT